MILVPLSGFVADELIAKGLAERRFHQGIGREGLDGLL